MKRSICLSLMIISTFFLSRYSLRILAYFDVELIGRSLRLNTYWGIALLIVLLVSAILYGYKNALASLGMSKGLWRGMGQGLLFTLPMILGYAVIGELQSDKLLIYGLATIFFYAAMEEVVYRGFLFGQLFQKVNWGFIPAVLINAVIFGIGHLYQGNSFEHTAGVFAITFMGAIWFSWIYIEWESNLWVAISLHFFMNLSWHTFGVGETALGGWGANLFRVITIAFSVVATIAYRQNIGHFRVNRNNLFKNSAFEKTVKPIFSGRTVQVCGIIILLAFFQSSASAQTISGIVKTVDSENLSYVNIGIVGTSIGTVSEEDGIFTLYLSENSTSDDTLRISMIGYKSQSFRVENITEFMDVVLEEDVFTLSEIVVKPKFANTETQGLGKVKGSRNVNFSIAKKARQNLGAEIGKGFKVKRKKTTQIETVRFYIRSNDFQEAKFRLLFYTTKNGKPDKYITDQDIIVTVSDKKSGWIDVDVSEYEILTNENFIVSLQWVDASKDGKRLAMPINFPILGSHHYYKFGSQAKWKHFRNMSATMNVRLSY